MEMYMVARVKTDIELDILGQTYTLPLTWADGMIGAIAVFDNLEDAENYADGADILTLERA